MTDAESPQLQGHRKGKESLTISNPACTRNILQPRITAWAKAFFLNFANGKVVGEYSCTLQHVIVL